MYKIAVSKQVMQALKPALPFAKGTIQTQIEKGICQLYQTTLGNLIVVTRPEGSELVIVAVAGTDLLSSQQEILAFAKVQGFTTLRFHTRHPKRLAKGLQGLNFYHFDTRAHLFGGTEYIFKLGL